jgi:hypothetical protein
MMLTNDIILGYHISSKGIQVDLEKVKVILNFSTPTLQKQVQIFLGYNGYYHRFIEKFACISLPLVSLLNKYIEFVWIETC